MCGNIKKLRFPDRPATATEIDAAVLQYVRKIADMRQPSAQHQAAFDLARAEIAEALTALLDGIKGRKAAAVAMGLSFKPLRSE